MEQPKPCRMMDTAVVPVSSDAGTGPGVGHWRFRSFPDSGRRKPSLVVVPDVDVLYSFHSTLPSLILYCDDCSYKLHIIASRCTAE